METRDALRQTASVRSFSDEAVPDADVYAILDDARFDLLYEACRLHTDGHTAGDPTLLACWDADRLDLGRVGITPKPALLCTEAARTLIPWAQQRAQQDHPERRVLQLWGR